MLKRKVMKQLRTWKSSDNKKSLIISGARQIGKTFIVRAFAKESYDYFIELNFIENPEYKNIFEGGLDVDTLIMNISLYIEDAEFVPHKTLILFDEVQECPKAVTSLKFWTDNGSYDVIATGSGLGMNYMQESSYPVGNVEYIDMYSLDFEEFLWANNVSEQIIIKIEDCYNKKIKVPEAMHIKLLELLKLYMVVGGMPEVVNIYVQTKNMLSVDEAQKRIYRDYIVDIAHYASPDIKIKAEKCYRSIPFQLSKENHKFQYSYIESKGTSGKFGSSIDWLVNAYMIMPVYNLKKLEYPPEMYVEDTNFRIYPTDIGLLFSAYDYSLKKAMLEDTAFEDKSKNLMIGTAKGGLYEALIADMLIKRGYKKIFFYKNVKSTMELEFVIVGEAGILPIEVKAGRKKANSLDGVLKFENVEYGYKLSSQNVGVAGKRITLPLYMCMFI